jgi:hypothetical protein
VYPRQSALSKILLSFLTETICFHIDYFWPVTFFGLQLVRVPFLRRQIYCLTRKLFQATYNANFYCLLYSHLFFLLFFRQNEAFFLWHYYATGIIPHFGIKKLCFLIGYTQKKTLVSSFALEYSLVFWRSFWIPYVFAQYFWQWWCRSAGISSGKVCVCYQNKSVSHHSWKRLPSDELRKKADCFERKTIAKRKEKICSYNESKYLSGVVMIFLHQSILVVPSFIALN